MLQSSSSEEQVVDEKKEIFDYESALEDEDESNMKLNPDEATMLESVFLTCDDGGTGFVKVSTIIDYLRNLTTDTESNEIMGFLDDLSLIFDPTGKDVLIDAITYQEGICKWIGNIKQKDVTDPAWELTSTPERRLNGVVYRGKGEGAQQMSEHMLSSSFSRESIDGIQSWSSDMEESDIIEKIKELQGMNRKLGDENSKLQQQIEATEENNNSLVQEVEKLRKQSTRFEHLYEKAKRVEKEYIDLKTSISEYQTAKDEMAKKASLLEKEVSTLQNSLEECRRKVSEAGLVSENLKEEQKVLQQELKDKKSACEKLEELLEIKSQLTNESSSRSEYMSAVITELTFANQMLKTEKSKLEIELSETKHELSRINVRDDMNIPMLTSTPYHNGAPTLREELNAEAISPGIYSPGKKRHEKHDTSLDDDPFGISSSSQNESGMSDGARSIATNQSMDKYTSVAHKIARKFKKRKEMALKQIEVLAATDTVGENEDRSEVIAKELESELELFSSKISSLALAKQVAERRAAKFFILFRRLKAENKCLRDSKGKILESLGDLSVSQEDMEKRNGLSVSLEPAHIGSEDNEKRRNEKNSSMAKESSESAIEFSSPMKTKGTYHIKEDLEEQINDLKHLVESLENRQHESDKRVFDLEEQLDTKSNICAKQQEKLMEFEKKSVAQGYPSMSEEIREILNMVPSLEGCSPSRDEPVTLAQIKVKLTDYISTTQMKMKSVGIRDSPDGGPVGSIFESEIKRVSQAKRPPIYQGHVYESPSKHLDAQFLHTCKSTQTEITALCCTSTQTEMTMPDIDHFLRYEAKEDVNHNLFTPAYSSTNTTPLPNDILEAKKLSPNKGLEITVDRKVPEDPADFSTDPEASSEPAESLSTKQRVTLNDDELLSSDRLEANINRGNESPLSFDYNDKDTSCSDDEVTMNLRLRQKRLSKESLDETKRKPSVNSTASELSLSSGSLKRGRRIGISAEPVRLPTWSDIRELYKLNQQIEMEDALQTNGDKDSCESISDTQAHPLPQDNERIPSRSGQKLFYSTSLSSRPELRKQRSVTFSLPEGQEEPEMEEPLTAQDNEGMKSCTEDDTDTKLPSDQSLSLYSSEDVTKEQTQDTAQTCSPKQNNMTSPKPSLESLPTFLTNYKSVTEITDIERKYNNVVLNFKTDQYTLQKRLDSQERARDVAESGMEKELEKLTSAIKHIEKLSLTYELQDAVASLHKNTDVLRRAGMKVSAQAEQHGCYQKEFLMSRDIEIMISYADHLRLKIETIQEEHINLKYRPRPSLECIKPVATEAETSDQMRKKSDEPSFAGDICKKAFASSCTEQETSNLSSGKSFYSFAKSFLKNSSTKNVAEGSGMSSDKSATMPPAFATTLKDNRKARRQVSYANIDSIIPEESTESSRIKMAWTSGVCKALMNFLLAVALLTLFSYIAVTYFEVDFKRLHKKLSEKVHLLVRQYLHRNSEQFPM